MELETNLLTHYRLMKGIVGLKSPLELNFEGISEIKKYGEDEQDIHDFPMTTKFINMEITRSRAGTADTKRRKDTFPKGGDLESSRLSLEKKREELHKLFEAQNERRESKEKEKGDESPTPPDSGKVRLGIFFGDFILLFGRLRFEEI